MSNVKKNTFTFNASFLWSIKDNKYTKNLIFNNGFLKVENPEIEVIYQSTEIYLNTFLELVLSWNFNSLNNNETTFEVAIGDNSHFSDYFLMGQIINNRYMSKKNQENSFGKVNTDILINKNFANQFIKLKFIAKPNNEGFMLHNISITKKETTSFTFDESSLIEKIIDVPKINQRSVPEIGNKICSPTSLTMVLNYYGNNLNNALIASKVYDYGEDIYGNWSFNASFAYKYGLYSRVEYIEDFNAVVSYIKKNIPVIMSIGVATIVDPNNKINYPYGHLIVLVGFKKINNIWYAVVNDPATFLDEEVLRFYKLDVLLSAFKKIVYIIKKNEF